MIKMGLSEPIPQSERCILDLVTFEDVLINYNKNDHIILNFTMNTQLRGSTFDWIGIFEAGWDTYESFLAFEWGIGEPVDDSGRKRRIKIDSQYLKRAISNTNYQFVYISKYLEILGVSQFFHFVEDDDLEESFCLSASLLPKINLHNSTEREINREEYIELVKENKSPGKRVLPTCSINLPNNWEEAYTSCWRCQSLFEMKNKHNELISKLKFFTEQNDELKERLSKLEIALENAWFPKTLLESWDEQKERLNFEHFVTYVQKKSREEGYEKGDHWSDEEVVAPRNTVNMTSPAYDYFSNDATRKELLLKAIIGSQEDKIRELTRTVSQLQHLILPRLPKSLVNTDIVTLVKARERIIPEIIDLENCREETNESNDNDDLPVLDSAIEPHCVSGIDETMDQIDAVKEKN